MSMNWRGFTKDPWDKGNYAEVQGPSGSARVRLSAIALVLLGLSLANLTPASAQDAEPTGVITEAELREAWADPMRTSIELGGDIFLRQCKTGDPIRESARPMTLDGNGHTIRQTCFEKRVLRQDGTGYLLIKDVTLTRGGSDGPGAAVTTRGEIEVVGSKVQQNLAEEPGGGIFSMRRATIRDSIITNNLANDDGGGVYARRGGVQVFDSTVSNNLVDGSGGAIGSTGDILLVRSHSDGNTTDGDGGALYADEDGDVTVVDSTVDGSDADGPGGAIWTLDGHVRSVLSPAEDGTRVAVAVREVDPGKTHHVARSDKTQVAYVLEGKDATLTHTGAARRPNTRRSGARASTWSRATKRRLRLRQRRWSLLLVTVPKHTGEPVGDVSPAELLLRGVAAPIARRREAVSASGPSGSTRKPDCRARGICSLAA